MEFGTCVFVLARNKQVLGLRVEVSEAETQADEVEGQEVCSIRLRYKRAEIVCCRQPLASTVYCN